MNASAIETGFDKLVRTAVREEVATFRKELLAALASGKSVVLNGASKPNGKANGAAHHTSGASNGAAASAKASKAKAAKVVAASDKINRSEFIRERPNLSVKELKAEALSLGFELKDNLIYNIRSQDRKKGTTHASPKVKAVKADGVKTAAKAAKVAAPAKEAKAAKAKAAPTEAKAEPTKAAAPVDKGVQNIVKVLGKETMSPPEVLGALKGAGRAPSASEPLKYVSYLLSSNVGTVFERVGKSYRVLENAGKAEAPKAAAKAKAASKAAKVPAQESGRGEKSAFIRARPNDKPKDIVEAAKKEGIELTADLVYNIRSQDKKAKEAGGGGKAAGKGKTSGKAERVASNDAEPVEVKTSEDSAAGDPQSDESEANAVTAVIAAAAEVESPISAEVSVVKAAEPAVVSGSNARNVLEELCGDDGYANPFE